MKRLWIGVGLLSVLLLAGILPQLLLVPRQERIARGFSQAAELSRQGKQVQAVEEAQAARSLWLRGRDITAAITDHEPVEQMQLLLLRLEQAEDPEAFADLCAQLAATADAIADSHRLNWWSLF